MCHAFSSSSSSSLCLTFLYFPRDWPLSFLDGNDQHAMSASLKTTPHPPSPSPSSLQEHHTIPPLIISDCSHVKDTLSCLLHTILFQRSLGPIVVRDCTCDFCDVTYCQAKSASKSKGGDDNDFVVGKYVDDKIQRVIEHCMQMAVSTESSSQRGDSFVALLREDHDDDDKENEQKQQRE